MTDPHAIVPIPASELQQLRESHAALLAALKLFTLASMSEVRPSRGESFIGWQKGDGADARSAMDAARAAIAAATGPQSPQPMQRISPYFANVSCSQCGQDFGPGDHGFSHCQNHAGMVPR